MGGLQSSICMLTSLYSDLYNKYLFFSFKVAKGSCQRKPNAGICFCNPNIKLSSVMHAEIITTGWTSPLWQIIYVKCQCLAVVCNLIYKENQTRKRHNWFCFEKTLWLLINQRTTLFIAKIRQIVEMNISGEELFLWSFKREDVWLHRYCVWISQTNL